MNIDIRNQLQEKAATLAYNAKYHGILDLSPRFGKSRTALLAFEKLSGSIRLLIAAPFNTILESWKKEVELWGSKHHITYCNTRSIDNIDFSTIDAVILDECHYLSDFQNDVLRLCAKPILGLTGSLSDDNRKHLKKTLGLKPIYIYSIEEAIEDKVISDFTINLHYVELDNKEKIVEYGPKKKLLIGTELQAYQWATSNFERFKYMSYSNPALSNVKMKYAGDRSRIIYNSINKIKKTKQLSKNKKKSLIFTGLTKVADLVCINSFHSKSSENNLEKFINNEFNKLAVVNMANMGITDKKLKHIIINQLQSKEENSIQRMMRAMNFEEGKEAVIDVIVVKDTVDEDWVNKALKWVKPDKIKINGVNTKKN